LTLQSASGGACYPFKDAMGSFEKYPESNEDQCVEPVDDDSKVCGYKYDPSSSSCDGRKYEIETFTDEAEADAAGAAIVHKGACGVCSSAQDFGARIKTYGILETETIKCATSYVFTSDFGTLTACFEALGFTNACATLWAHLAATNSKTCSVDCLPGASGVTELNGPAPTCAPAKCLQCQEAFRGAFDSLSGMQFNSAGITERIAQTCDSFYPIEHDPCVGLSSDSSGGGGGDDTAPVAAPTEETAPATDPPAPEENGGGSSAANGNGIATAATIACFVMTLIGTMVLA